MENMKCNECGEVVKIPKLRRSVLPNIVYEYYFHCPECNHKYVSYYTDQRIRRDINRKKKRYKKLNQSKSDEEIRRIQAHIKMQDKVIKREMDALYNEMRKGVAE